MRVKKGAKICINNSDKRTMLEHRLEFDKRGFSDVVREVVVSISRSSLWR